MVERSTSTNKINNFGIIRLFAAVQVVLVHGYHYLDLPDPIWLQAIKLFPGVPIFFVTSGFLISASWMRSPGLIDYIGRRAARIFPALWLCILLTLIASASFGFFGDIEETFQWSVLQLFGVIYTPGFLRQFGIGSYNSSLWTIPVEIQFYVVAPIILFIGSYIGRQKTLLLACLFVFTTFALVAEKAFPIHLDNPQNRFSALVGHSFLPYIYMFLAGAALRLFDTHHTKLLHGKGAIWLVFYIFVLYLERIFGISECFVRLVLCVLTISAAYTVPNLSAMTLGDFDPSYGIYIYHGLILNIIKQIGESDNYTGLTVLIILTLIVATISWIFIEKPLLQVAHSALLARSPQKSR